MNDDLSPDTPNDDNLSYDLVPSTSGIKPTQEHPTTRESAHVDSLAGMFLTSQLLGQREIYFTVPPNDIRKLDNTLCSMLLVLEMETKDHGKVSPIPGPLRY